MIVWSSPEDRAARANAEAVPSGVSARQTAQALADARSWGFAHGVRFPHRLFNADCPRGPVTTRVHEESDMP